MALKCTAQAPTNACLTSLMLSHYLSYFIMLSCSHALTIRVFSRSHEHNARNAATDAAANELPGEATKHQSVKVPKHQSVKASKRQSVKASKSQRVEASRLTCHTRKERESICKRVIKQSLCSFGDWRCSSGARARRPLWKMFVTISMVFQIVFLVCQQATVQHW